MRRLGRHSTAELYHAAGAHFRRFLGGDRPLTSITATMVDDFRGYLKGLRLRVNTINSYLSGLRAVYNAACRERGIARTVHPFAHLRLRREATAKRAIPVRDTLLAEVGHPGKRADVLSPEDGHAHPVARIAGDAWVVAQIPCPLGLSFPFRERPRQAGRL